MPAIQVSSKPPAVQLAGRCANCGRNIPHGYLYVVLKWTTLKWGSRPVQQAAEILCRECGNKHINSKTKKQEQTMAEVVELTPKQVAQRLMAEMSQETAHSSKYLAEHAEIEYSDTVVQVLKALEAAGVVEREKQNGWWKLI